MKLRTLAIVFALCMVMGLTVCAAGAEDNTKAAAEGTTEAAEDTDVYEKMKEIYVNAAVGQGKDEFYYILSYDENMDNAIFILMDKDGKSSFNVVGPVTQEDSWLTITDSSDNNTFTFGVKDDLTEKGFTMVAQKNNEEIPMEFCDAAQVVDVIKAIDQNTEIVNPFAEEDSAAEADTTAEAK